MSLTTMIMWHVVCDECGVSAFENDDFICWHDEEGALETFEASAEDWSSFEGKHRCPAHNPFCERCGKDAGEFCGERDFMCPACFAMVPA